MRDTSALQNRPSVLGAVKTQTGPPAAITALTFTPDSNTLTFTTDDTTRIWDTATARWVSDLPPIRAPPPPL